MMRLFKAGSVKRTTESLRFRLLAGMMGGMIALLMIFGFIIYSVIEHDLFKQFDVSLRTTAQTLAALVEYDPEDGSVDLEFNELVIPEFEKAKRPGYYQIWQENGTILARSGSLGQNDLLPWPSVPGASRFITLKLPHNGRGRAFVYVFNPRIENSDEFHSQTSTLVVARYTGELEDKLKYLGGLLIITAAVTIILSFIVALLVVGRGLKPLQSLSDEIASIREDTLSMRVGTERLPSEMQPIKQRLNNLLSRLEASFCREKRFTADVAHEFRTPLAGLRSTLEVTQMRQRDISEYKASLDDCLAIVKKLQAMVDNLLTLARIEAGQMTFKLTRMQPASLLDNCWRTFADKARQRKIRFENLIPAETTCPSDPQWLSLVMSNLLDNAVEYTDSGGRIWTEAEKINDTVEITMSNTGCELTEEQVSQVFDCFWQGDTSRSDTGVHCGLGLSLVQRIVNALGGSIRAEVKRNKIFTLKITFPKF